MRYPDYFNQAITTVLKHEGIDSDEEADRGGRTRFGISLRFLRSIGIPAGDLDGDGDVDRDDIAAVTIDGATRMYFERFWSRYYEEIAVFKVAEQVFDFAVNMGPKQAERLLQRATNVLLSHDPDSQIREDGAIGPLSIVAINKAGAPLIKVYGMIVARFYFDLVQNDNSQIVFLKGWLRRAYGVSR